MAETEADLKELSRVMELHTRAVRSEQGRQHWRLLALALLALFVACVLVIWYQGRVLDRARHNRPLPYHFYPGAPQPHEGAK